MPLKACGDGPPFKHAGRHLIWELVRMKESRVFGFGSAVWLKEIQMRISPLFAISATLSLFATSALAEGISTHVLDLARGVGGQDVPVTLEIKQADGSWHQLAQAKTDENGRVRSFGDDIHAQAAVYKLTFDMSQYPTAGTQPFFPEIDVVFRVTDPMAHHHVPVVVSPYGYSTYRGN